MNRALFGRGVASLSRPFALLRTRRPDGWLLFAVAVVALAVAMRLLLYQRFPIFFTNDSPDYLRGSERIAAELDFSSGHLRDWRPPGYPVFLALLQWCCTWSSASVVLAQKLGGVACVALGLAAGRSLGWRLGGVVIGAFLALHPVYLLFEHVAMSEALFTVLLWAFATLCIVTVGRNPGVLYGLLLGAAFSACVLTRAPGFFLCAPVLLGVMLFSLARGPDDFRKRLFRLVWFALGLFVAVAAIIGPWSYRNYLLYGTLSPFTNNAQRTLLAYMAVHKVMDPNAPEMRSLDQDMAKDRRSASGKLIRRLGSGPQAEQKAGRLLRAQIHQQKWKYLTQVGYSLRSFLGLPVPPRHAASHDVIYWYNRYVLDVPATRYHNANFMRMKTTFTYVKKGRDGRLLRLWAAAGVAYLTWGRTALVIIFGLSVVTYLLTGGFRRAGQEQAVVVLFSVGFLSAAICHAVLLAGKERYAVPWDGFQVLVIAGVLDHLARERILSTPCCRVMERVRGRVNEPDV